jgi:hypothetical protein
MNVDSLLEQINQLPPDWHLAGSVSKEVLSSIVKYVGLREIAHSLETGTGKTTLLLSHLSANHKVFTVASDASGSYEAVAASPLLNRDHVEFIVGSTQKTLPRQEFDCRFQFALIDGPHAYPFPDLEYYFVYPALEHGALFVLDDIQIPTIRNLFSFLKEDAMFELIEVVGNTAFFRRTAAPTFDPFGDGWEGQLYNTKNSPRRAPRLASKLKSLIPAPIRAIGRTLLRR